MKTVTAYRHPLDRIPYPNAATGREVLHKLLDTVLVAASGVGIAAIIMLVAVL